MRLLDKYTLKEFLGPFLFGVAAFTAIFLGADTLLKIASYVTKYGASPVSALKIFILALPRIVVYTFPMAVLLGALMCFSRSSCAPPARASFGWQRRYSFFPSSSASVPWHSTNMWCPGRIGNMNMC